MTLVILACALPGIWWPIFVVLFYILSVFPTIIARRAVQDAGTSQCLEASIFITMGILISSFALPIVLARKESIGWLACNLTIGGNIVVYLTILGYFLFMDTENNYGGVY